MSEQTDTGASAETDTGASAETDTGVSEQRRIGVYICHCGGNISDYVDVAAVREALKDQPDVVVAETRLFACSDGTQHEMIADIKDKKLDGLVVASCPPKLHPTRASPTASPGKPAPWPASATPISSPSMSSDRWLKAAQARPLPCPTSSWSL